MGLLAQGSVPEFSTDEANAAGTAEPRGHFRVVRSLLNHEGTVFAHPQWDYFVQIKKAVLIVTIIGIIPFNNELSALKSHCLRCI